MTPRKADTFEDSSSRRELFCLGEVLVEPTEVWGVRGKGERGRTGGRGTVRARRRLTSWWDFGWKEEKGMVEVGCT